MIPGFLQAPAQWNQKNLFTKPLMISLFPCGTLNCESAFNLLQVPLGIQVVLPLRSQPLGFRDLYHPVVYVQL